MVTLTVQLTSVTDEQQGTTVIAATVAVGTLLVVLAVTVVIILVIAIKLRKQRSQMGISKPTPLPLTQRGSALMRYIPVS